MSRSLERIRRVAQCISENRETCVKPSIVRQIEIERTFSIDFLKFQLAIDLVNWLEVTGEFQAGTIGRDNKTLENLFIEI